MHWGGRQALGGGDTSTTEVRATEGLCGGSQRLRALVAVARLSGTFRTIVRNVLQTYSWGG